MSKKNKKEYKVFQPLLLGLSMAIGIVLGGKMSDTNQDSHWVKKIDDSVVPIGRVEEIIRYIDEKYIDSLDQDHLLEVATQSILNELDEYSEYIESDSDKTLAKSLNGKQEGIGIEEIVIDDRHFVFKVFKNSSSESNGIKVGDEIIAFDNKYLSEDSINEVKNKWFKSSPLGSECLLTVSRNFGKDTLHITTSKNYINYIEPTPGMMVDSNTAYIKIDQFSKDSYRTFMDHYERLYNETQFRNLIIDLRGNTGGYVQDAINVLNQFFNEKGKLLLTTINRSKEETTYKSTGRSFFKVEGLYVLIDNHSASASEIVASVIQDWDKGTIIGQESYGKGLIQEYFPLYNGDKIKLSVAKYITPIGRSIYRDPLVSDTSEVLFKSKIKKRILKSGKVIPDILIDDNPLVPNAVSNYFNNYVEAFVLYKIYTDKNFIIESDSKFENSEVLVELLEKIFLHYEFKEDFNNAEVDKIKELLDLNYRKFTTDSEAFQAYKNNTDDYIKQALELIK